MLPEELKTHAVAAAIEAWDSSALTGGSLEYGETLLRAEPAKVAALCGFLKSEFSFVRLSGISCIDLFPIEPRFEVLYLLHSIERNERLNLKVSVAGGAAQVDSVTGVWAGADWYEREVYDLFGVFFNGHPDMRRIMMPEGWDGHPLRKDFPVHGHKYSYQND